MMSIEKCFFPIYFTLLFFLTTSYLTFMLKAYFNRKISFVLPLLWKDKFMKDIRRMGIYKNYFVKQCSQCSNSTIKSLKKIVKCV